MIYVLKNFSRVVSSVICEAATSVASLEVQLYNQKFEKYIVYYPTTTRGSTIKKLISEAIAGKDDITITVKSVGTFGGNSEKHLSQALPLINDNQEWYCGTVIYDENGRITGINFGD